MSVNPFLGYGRIVGGTRLVGRESILKDLVERISVAAGSLSIVGEPQIGKSSLVIEALRQSTDSGAQIATCVINTATLDNGRGLFRLILSGLRRSAATGSTEMRELVHGFGDDEVQGAETNYEAFERTELGLRSLRRVGIRSVAVLDEFDGIRLYDEPERTIIRLRELADHQDETGLSIIFVSRRTLFSLEKQLEHISNIDNLCERFYVTPLDEQGLAEMLDRPGGGNSLWSEGALGILKEYTGGHPWLAEMVLCRGWNDRNVGHGASASLADFYDHYERLRKLLDEDGLFDKMLQACIGPRWSLTAEAEERLLRYGVIRRNGGQGFLGWSTHFQMYLEKCWREAPTWTLWSETEKTVRETIDRAFRQKLGLNWIEEIGKGRDPEEVSSMLDRCKERMERERKAFGFSGYMSPLDYAYPMDLWSLISKEWGTFGQLFGSLRGKTDKRYWRERFELLSRVRTPYAHSRDHVVPEHEVNLANGYCREILDALRTNLASPVE